MTHDNPSYGFRYRTLIWLVSIGLALMLLGCDNALIIRVINQGTEGNNNIWVCDGGSAEQCRGENKGDIDPEGFQKRLQVVAPPKECEHGRTYTMDVVIEAGKISRVRYECGLPDVPTGLPPSGLPPSRLPSSTDTPRTN